MSEVHSKFGFPVVNAENIFDVLADLGIKPWSKASPVISLDEYIASGLDDAQQAELRFAPKTEVVSLIDHRNRPFRGFRSVGKDWATVFTLLPGDLVPIVGEYKHGADEVTLVPPSGVPTKADLQSGDPMAACAMREWEEETGLKLVRVEALTDQPLMISGRQSTVRYNPYLGTTVTPLIKGKSKLDDTEQLKMVLVPLTEWLKLIANGRGIEDCAVSVTFLGLQALGRIGV